MTPTGPATDADLLARIMRARWSCRAFLPQEVDPGVIDAIFAAAQTSASWCNAQPWQVIVTRGAATARFRDALAAHAGDAAPDPDIAFPAEYRGVYRERRRACAMQLYEAVGVAMGDRVASARQAARNFTLFGAPHAVLVTTDAALGPYGLLDCGAWVAAFQLAATAHGLASVAQASIAGFAPMVRAHFGIPDGRHLVCGIAVGHADMADPANGFRTSRAALADVVDIRG